MSDSMYAYLDRGFAHEFQRRSLTFYTSKTWYRTPSSLSLTSADEEDKLNPFQQVNIPEDVQSFTTFADCAMLLLRTPWKIPIPQAEGAEEETKAKEYVGGTLLTAPIQEVLKGDWSNVTVLFEPQDNISLSSRTSTKNYLILKTLQDVRTVLRFWKYQGNGKWIQVEEKQKSSSADDNDTAPPKEAVKVGEDISVSAVDSDGINHP